MSRVRAVGGWWNRQNNPEVDIVGMSSNSRQVAFVGSIKWHQKHGFSRRDYTDLVRDATHVPGATDQTAMLAVSRTSALSDDLPVTSLGPEDLLAAWQ